MPPDRRRLPPLFSRIPHYYGDVVRSIFIVVAIISVISIPVWGDLMPVGTTVQVAWIIILIILAGLTNPYSESILWADVVISALGAIVLEEAAIRNYSINDVVIFLIRELLVVLLLAALYFSLKTVRAMLMGTIDRNSRNGVARSRERFSEPMGDTDVESSESGGDGV